MSLESEYFVFWMGGIYTFTLGEFALDAQSIYESIHAIQF